MDRRDFLAALAAALAAPGCHAARTDPAVGPGRSRAGSAPALEAVVLGSVQDAGLPQVGCYSDRCDRAREAARAGGLPRYVASLALVAPADARFWLVDATPDITRQIDLLADPVFRARAGERRPFDGVFLTHAHVGHYLGLALLGNEGLGVRDTPVYCTPAMAAFLEENAPWSLMVDQGRIVPTPLAPGDSRRVHETLSVRPLRVPHRDEFADTVGFVFQGPSRSLLYLPDIDRWDAWDRDVVEVVESVDVALLDGSFWSGAEVPGRPVEDIPHPLVPDTMDRLQDVVRRGAARVVFTHLNNSNPALDADGPQAREVARRGFEIAREGTRISL